MDFSNAYVAKLLRSVAASISLSGGNSFEIRAYENAADSIEHLTSSLQDLWEEESLGEVPGLGVKLQAHINELFKTGKVGHFDSLLNKYPKQIYDFLDIPGIGPKTALKLAEVGVKSVEDLGLKIKDGELIRKGLSEAIVKKLQMGLSEFEGRSGRMLLSTASILAQSVLDNLAKSSDVLRADALGSLKRRVASIGDVDVAASSKKPEEVVKFFVKMPIVKEVVNEGENKATVVLKTGEHVDLLVSEAESYGSLLQHFTGSKNHNIALRTYAEGKGLSISEHGIKKSDGELILCDSEEDVYKVLGMETPAPEIRENTGEIELAIKHQLPALVEFKEIKGDMHLHSNYKIEPSHDSGVNSMEEIVVKAIDLGYDYVGISDHQPAVTTHSNEQILSLVKKRSENIEQIKKSRKSIRVLNGLEVDIMPDGRCGISDEALKMLDYCVVGIHSAHRSMDKETMTKRILTALKNPYVNILAHPTGRLIDQRDSFDADWEEIFRFCKANKKILEINSHPQRLDLRDDLVRVAVGIGAKLIIDTDAHEVNQMDNMPYGVSVARRGWAEKSDILNTLNFCEFEAWL